jgi:hypothetical protein
MLVPCGFLFYEMGSKSFTLKMEATGSSESGNCLSLQRAIIIVDILVTTLELSNISRVITTTIPEWFTD